MNDTREQLAKLLYEMNGFPLYGRSLGDWNDENSRIGPRHTEIRERWYRQADLILASLKKSYV